MPVTAATIIEAALKKINVLGAGQTINAADQALALSELNDLIDVWRTQRRFVLHYTQVSAAFGSSKVSYSIGSSDADIIAARPVRIETANLVVVSENPDKRKQLRIIDVHLFSRIDVPEQSGPEPEILYYKPTYPKGTLYPWPYPENSEAALANKLELFYWSQLERFASVSTSVDLADGYEAALKLSLAEILAPIFGVVPSDILRAHASAARMLIGAINTPDSVVSTIDYGMPRVGL
jgi:hypothetical protein